MSSGRLFRLIIISLLSICTASARDLNITSEDEVPRSMEDTWYFWYDCTEDLAVCKNLSDFESLCSSDERPEFVITNSGDINYVANSGGFGIAGFFNFESDNDVVLGIAVIGLLVIVGMIVQKSFKLAEKNPILNELKQKFDLDIDY